LTSPLDADHLELRTLEIALAGQRRRAAPAKAVISFEAVGVTPARWRLALAKLADQIGGAVLVVDTEGLWLADASVAYVARRTLLISDADGAAFERKGRFETRHGAIAQLELEGDGPCGVGWRREPGEIARNHLDRKGVHGPEAHLHRGLEASASHEHDLVPKGRTLAGSQLSELRAARIAADHERIGRGVKGRARWVRFGPTLVSKGDVELYGRASRPGPLVIEINLCGVEGVNGAHIPGLAFRPHGHHVPVHAFVERVEELQIARGHGTIDSRAHDERPMTVGRVADQGCVPETPLAFVITGSERHAEQRNGERELRE